MIALPNGTRFRVLCGDCRSVPLPDCSVDSVVTDPPYGLKFMGKVWDNGVPGVPFWEAALRVAKPGAHLLAFGGTRKFHRLACAIEDAGWELRDTVMWVYGSGFPKSHDVSKAIDKAAGAERERIRGVRSGVVGPTFAQDAWSQQHKDSVLSDEPLTEAAQWNGWGTALKPAWEPVIVARKPLEGTVAANVQKHGTGALNIDGCRVSASGPSPSIERRTHAKTQPHGSWDRSKDFAKFSEQRPGEQLGRWPANLIHDGSEEVVGLFPESNGSKPGSFHRVKTSKGLPGGGYGQERAYMRDKTDLEKPGYADNRGSAARFFYCAKASKRDRDEGCVGLAERQYSHDGRETPIENPYQRNGSEARNHHPTVKPTDLMRYLCRLVTPPGGLVFDPFMGSGSTGKAAILEGFQFVGCDTEQEYVEIATARIEHAARQPSDDKAGTS